MYLLTTFKKQEKEKSTKELRNRALLSGGLVVPGLVDIGLDTKKGINLIKAEKEIKDKLVKNKKALTETHPDKLIGEKQPQHLIDKATEKFKQLSNEKDQLRKLQNSTDKIKDLKGINKLKKAIGIGIENELIPKLENLAKIQGKKINPKRLPKFLKGVKLVKKVGYGLTGLGTISTGLAVGRYINSKRKERADKGKIRGKYSK